MRSVREFRLLCQDSFQVRALSCPDGLVRLVALHRKGWEALDALLTSVPSVDDQIILDDIFQTLLPSCYQAEAQGWPLDDAFREHFYYYVLFNYNDLIRRRDGLTNDNDLLYKPR
ncbi:hypothetical protein [Oceanobacter antarcticus]|uniref:Uncharacterized protein n=1 Tax=Oceanobacter antarcticus TaxID=3133425 RepID=A0ABW8NDP6_9GAMM